MLLPALLCEANGLVGYRSDSKLTMLLEYFKWQYYKSTVLFCLKNVRILCRESFALQRILTFFQQKIMDSNIFSTKNNSGFAYEVGIYLKS